MTHADLDATAEALRGLRDALAELDAALRKLVAGVESRDAEREPAEDDVRGEAAS